MIPALTAIWAARGTILAALPWALAVAGLLGALWYRAEYEKSQASIAAEAAKAQELVNAYKASDAQHTRLLAEQLRPVTDAIERQARDTSIALAKVPSNPNCAKTPAAAAFDAAVGKK